MDTSDILARPHRMNAERETPFVEGFATELASVGHSALTINGYLVWCPRNKRTKSGEFLED